MKTGQKHYRQPVPDDVREFLLTHDDAVHDDLTFMIWRKMVLRLTGWPLAREHFDAVAEIWLDDPKSCPLMTFAMDVECEVSDDVRAARPVKPVLVVVPSVKQGWFEPLDPTPCGWVWTDDSDTGAFVMGGMTEVVRVGHRRWHPGTRVYVSARRCLVRRFRVEFVEGCLRSVPMPETACEAA